METKTMTQDQKLASIGEAARALAQAMTDNNASFEEIKLILIGTASRVKAEEIDPYNTETLYKMPSGLGGVFCLKFIEQKGRDFRFKIITPGFEREVTMTREHAFKQINKSL